MPPPAAASRLPWLAGAALVVLLVVFAGLQLRWLGEVAEADRQRLEAGVQAGLVGLATELDREVSRAWLVFRPASLQAPEASRVSRLLARWRSTAPSPGLVSDVLLVAADGTALHLDGDEWRPAGDWSPATAEASEADADSPPGPRRRPREGLAPATPQGRGERPEGPLRRSILRPELPALDFSVSGMDGTSGRLVVVFDRQYLAGELLPALVERWLEPVLGGAQWRLSTRDGEPVASSGTPGASYDWRIGLLDLLPPDEMRRLAFAGDAGESPMEPHGEGGPPHGRRWAAWRELADRDPGWVLEVRPAAGSLHAALARAHRGNAGIALGVLGLIGAAALALAISARRAQEMARRQLEFTAAVSHELRTPLTAIRSLAENLADGLVGDPAQVRVYGEQIGRQGERLTGMVEQVLALSAHETGSARLVRRPVPVASLVREAVADATAAFPDAEVELDVPADVAPLAGDPGMLRQAVGNLVGNALKHGGSPAWARVRAVPGTESGTVRLEVADHGPGIPAGEQERLFEPFFRGRRARERQLPGSGLGLHLVRRIAEAHGGRVAVESREGDGAVFSLELPAHGEER